MCVTAPDRVGSWRQSRSVREHRVQSRPGDWTGVSDWSIPQMEWGSSVACVKKFGLHCCRKKLVKEAIFDKNLKAGCQIFGPWARSTQCHPSVWPARLPAWLGEWPATESRAFGPHWIGQSEPGGQHEGWHSCFAHPHCYGPTFLVCGPVRYTCWSQSRSCCHCMGHMMM